MLSSSQPKDTRRPAYLLYPGHLVSPRRCGDDSFEIGISEEHLRTRLESGLLSRQVGCEVFTKLCRVKIIEPVCCHLYRGRLAQVTSRALPAVGLTLASIWHVGRDVH